MKQKAHNRERIVLEANRLFYEKGYNQASFADVAKQLNISKGNMTYHFRSKDELLNAVIECRMDSIRQQLLQWDKDNPEPASRLKMFVNMLRNEVDNLVRFGCPMGSINAELGKGQRGLQEMTRKMFDLFKAWLDENFKQIDSAGYQKKTNHLMSMAQGAALMAYVYSDGELLAAECEHMIDWINSVVRSEQD